MKLSYKLPKMFIAGAVFSCAAAMGASASPLTWFLQDVAFSNGATASGQFLYDADVLQFSGFDITVSSGGTDVPTNLLSGFGAGFGFDLFGPTGGTAGETFMQLVFQPLTNAGGSSNLVPGSFLSSCASTGSGASAGYYSCPLGSQFTYVSGAVTTMPAAVPLPAGLLLLVTGLGALGAFRRRSRV